MERQSWGEVTEKEGGGGVYLVELSALEVERRGGAAGGLGRWGCGWPARLRPRRHRWSEEIEKESFFFANQSRSRL
jgi:hypothetical protein